MPLFIAGATLLAGGASAAAGISGANKAASASRDAAAQSAEVQNRALDLQQQNTAVARNVGDQSINALAARFGLTPTTAQSGSGVPGGGTATYTTAAYMAANPDIGQAYDAQAAADRDFRNRFPTKDAYYDWHYNQYGQQEIANGQRAPLAISNAPAVSEEAATAAPSTIDSSGTYTVARPSLPEPLAYRETQIAPLDVSLDKYEKSPDYEFQQSEGNRNILANAAATGGLESGAALKALQKFGQDLAMGDYGQWRDYTTGQYNQDRAYTANRDDAANAFNSSQYQYRNTLAQNIYNSDRDYATNRYDTRTNNLLSLAGYGQNAVGQSNQAIGQNANALSQGYFGDAENRGNAALAATGQVSNFAGNAVNALAYYYGNRNQGGGSTYGASTVPVT